MVNEYNQKSLKVIKKLSLIIALMILISKTENLQKNMKLMIMRIIILLIIKRKNNKITKIRKKI